VLLDRKDVLAWAQGQTVRPTTPSTPLADAAPTPSRMRTFAKGVDQTKRLSESELRFDLSSDALRYRRSSWSDSHL
jgi:hypothetical protein